MPKETYYFSHDSNALIDTKILNMRADYGLEGYGLYWAIIEMMRNEESYMLKNEKGTYRAIKTLTNTDINVEKYVEDCIDDYKLFAEKDNNFFSPSFLNRMQQYEKKRQINRENGKLGGRPKKETKIKPDGFTEKTDGLEIKTQKNQNKIKENKGKENKVKESKIKENKRNEIKEIYNRNCSLLPQVQKLTDKRNKAINNFLKEFTEEQFEEICKIANNSKFLTGENDRGWKADFDFLMRIDKATNILEGKYNNKGRNE